MVDGFFLCQTLNCVSGNFLHVFSERVIRPNSNGSTCHLGSLIPADLRVLVLYKSVHILPIVGTPNKPQLVWQQSAQAWSLKSHMSYLLLMLSLSNFTGFSVQSLHHQPIQAYLAIQIYICVQMYMLVMTLSNGLHLGTRTQYISYNMINMFLHIHAYPLYIYSLHVRLVIQHGYGKSQCSTGTLSLYQSAMAAIVGGQMVYVNSIDYESSRIIA